MKRTHTKENKKKKQTEKKKKKKKDLGRCFFLLKKLPQVSDFCKIFEEHIHEEGLQVIQSIHEKALVCFSSFFLLEKKKRKKKGGLFD